MGAAGWYMAIRSRLNLPSWIEPGSTKFRRDVELSKTNYLRNGKLIGTKIEVHTSVMNVVELRYKQSRIYHIKAQNRPKIQRGFNRRITSKQIENGTTRQHHGNTAMWRQFHSKISNKPKRTMQYKAFQHTSPYLEAASKHFSAHRPTSSNIFWYCEMEI
jgi:hypothetical protein